MNKILVIICSLSVCTNLYLLLNAQQHSSTKNQTEAKKSHNQLSNSQYNEQRQTAATRSGRQPNNRREFLSDSPEALERAREIQRVKGITNIGSLIKELETAEEKWGDGSALSSVITDLFWHSSVPINELLEYLKSNPNNAIINSGMNGITLRFDDQSIASLEELGNLDSLVLLDLNGWNYGSILNSYISNGSPGRINEAISTLENVDFDLSPNLLSKIMGTLARDHDMASTELFLTAITESSLGFFDQLSIQSAVLKSLKGESAVAALHHLANDSRLDDNAQWSLAGNALNYSSVNLEEYTKLHPEDQVTRARFAQYQLQNGSTAELRTLLHDENFEENEIGKRLGGQLWTFESKQVKASSLQNPEKTVLDLADGTSDFDSLHLVTAVNEWMKVDGEAAAQWVEAEGVNLPPEDRQFVAISYAREAAKQGQADIALRWANLIIDERRKERVLREISSKN